MVWEHEKMCPKAAFCAEKKVDSAEKYGLKVVSCVSIGLLLLRNLL